MTNYEDPESFLDKWVIVSPFSKGHYGKVIDIFEHLLQVDCFHPDCQSKDLWDYETTTLGHLRKMTEVIVLPQNVAEKPKI